MLAPRSLTRSWVVGGCLGLVLASQAAGQTLAERGYRRAVGDCGQCHAMDATRDSPNPGAPSFADIGRRVTDDRALATRLKAVTRQGHYAMPPRSLSASDRRAVVAFIRSTADHAWRD